MKFTTTLEAVNSNKTKTTLKLSMSNSEARKFTAQYLNSIDKELVVTFEDPQMEMDLQPASGGRPGLVATINGQGEVESVMRELADEDENAESVLVQEESDDDQEEMDFADEETEAEESQEPESSEDSDDAEAAESDESSDQISSDELERYILAVRPYWDDLPYDFPTLLERKKAENLKWYQLAGELKVPSTKLQAEFGKYKKRCKEQMLNGAA